MENRVISIPWMGREYTKSVKQSLENLGLNIKLPPRTTNRTINLGVRNSPDMLCYPFKLTLGNFIESLEEGANTLLMYDTAGRCRFRHYWKVQEFILRNMGFDFEIYNLNYRNLLQTFKRLSGRSYLETARKLNDFWKKAKEIDGQKIAWAKDKPNIGILGEIFSCCDETANYGIERKVTEYGAKPVNITTLTEWTEDRLKDRIMFLKDEKRAFKKQARKYFNGPIGGHGYENVYNLLYLVDKGIEGIIHIMPLSCAPETMIEPAVGSICQKSGVPLLKIVVDENNSEANLTTRVETFVELIKMKERRGNG